MSSLVHFRTIAPDDQERGFLDPFTGQEEGDGCWIPAHLVLTAPRFSAGGNEEDERATVRELVRDLDFSWCYIRAVLEAEGLSAEKVDGRLVVDYDDAVGAWIRRGPKPGDYLNRETTRRRLEDQLDLVEPIWELGNYALYDRAAVDTARARVIAARAAARKAERSEVAKARRKEHRERKAPEAPPLYRRYRTRRQDIQAIEAMRGAKEKAFAEARARGLIPIAELAGILGLSVWTVRARIESGAIVPAERVMRSLWFRPVDSVPAVPRGPKKKAPEGFVSFAEFARRVGVSGSGVRKVIARYGVETVEKGLRLYAAEADVEKVKAQRKKRRVKA